MIKVLVVDDNLLELDFVEAALQHHSIECIKVSNPADAVRIASESKPDLVILDLFMPGVSGLDLCRELKTNPDTLSIPIMFLTADDSTDTLIQGVHLGIVDYIHKPINTQELVDAILIQNTATQLRTLFEPLKAKSRELMHKYGHGDD